MQFFYSEEDLSNCFTNSFKILEKDFQSHFASLKIFCGSIFWKWQMVEKPVRNFFILQKWVFWFPIVKNRLMSEKNCLSLNYLKNLKIKYFKTIRNIKIILYFSKNILLSCVSKTTSLFLSTTFNSTNFDRNTQFKPKCKLNGVI